MDKNIRSFKLRAGVGLIVSVLFMGQSVMAAQVATKRVSTKHAKAKKQAGVKTAQAAPVAKPAQVVAKPEALPVVKAPVGAALSADARELTEPRSFVEAGVMGVTDGNWKFGQYTGLTNSGAYGIGNFDLRGGGAFDSGDASRWRVTGKNIGLQNREFTGEYKEQGKFKLNFGYDEIYRNGQGSYQTPYVGVGGNELALPPNWGYPTASNMRTLPASDYLGFQNVDLATKRRRVDGGFSYNLSPEWEVKASMRHENKDGVKALGSSLASPPSQGLRGVILPDPVSQSTDQINASLNYTTDKGFASFAYYGSIFHNDFNSVTYQNAFGTASQAGFGRMSTMPDNQFHQFTLNGGYNFSVDTKLVGSGAYGRNWQDQAFLPMTTTSALAGQGNLNGAVDFKNLNLKLTHKANQDLNLLASYKYDERENLTAVNTYQYIAQDGLPTAATSERTNTPFSRRVQTGNLEANYSFIKGHWLKAGYELQNIDRWCNGTWVSCVDTASTMEHTGKLDYRGTLFDKLNAKLGYSYSHRDADNYNQDNAFLASYGPPETGQQWTLYNQYLASGLTAWGPALGYAPRAGVPYPYPALFVNNNRATNIVADASGGSDIAGFGRYNTASRNRQNLRSLFDYQLTDRLNMALSGDWRYDDYTQSNYGLQSAKNWSVNFDTSYAFSEELSGHVFYTYQDAMSNLVGTSYGSNSNTGTTTTGRVSGCYNSVLAMNNNAKTDPCRNWAANQSDNIDTVGLGLKHSGLFSGKLDLTGDFLYSFARTQMDINGGNYVQSLLTGSTSTNGPWYYIPAANMPEVKTQMFQFKLGGKYQINKSSAAHLTYLFQHLMSSDYIYTGMGPAGTPTGVMPTNEKAPTYTVHAFGLSYVYNF